MLDVDLELESDGVGWGDELRGRVIARAGRLPARLRSARVEIPGIAEAPIYLGPFAVLSRFIPAPVELAPGSEYEIPFSLRIPWYAYPQEQRDIRAIVRSDVGERSAHGLVWLAPPARLVRIVRILGELTGTAITGWEGFKDGDGISADFAPVDPQNRAFDRLKLGVYRQGEGFYGHLLLDLPERTVADRLRAAVGGDTRRLNVRFRPDDPGAVEEYLAGLLRPYIDPAWSLPVPSSAPGPAAETLPRPAGPAPMDGAALPRPAGAPEADRAG